MKGSVALVTSCVVVLVTLQMTLGVEVLKRPFCNALGCGNMFGKKRAPEQSVAPPVLGKRPFCNSGGCGNMFGRKRATEGGVTTRALEKRPFCNAGGCGNMFGRKRATEGDVTTRALEKRPFCNSGGCGNMFGRKRAAESAVKGAAVEKRPFCNSLGCGNIYGFKRATGTSAPAKRVFCNGLTGCGMSRLSRRFPVAGEAGGVKPTAGKRVFCNGFTGCSGPIIKKLSAAEMERNLSKALAKAQLWKAFMARLNTLRTKRVFCNGLVGCNNFGRRRRRSVRATH